MNIADEKMDVFDGCFAAFVTVLVKRYHGCEWQRGCLQSDYKEEEMAC